MSNASDGATVTLCPGGPMLVRGAAEVQDDTGTTWPVDRPVVALCRCRRSRRKPWCDSSHKAPRRVEAVVRAGPEGPPGTERKP